MLDLYSLAIAIQSLGHRPAALPALRNLTEMKKKLSPIPDLQIRSHILI
jgi:hypothetical protein